MVEKIAIELKKGQTFKVRNKRKKYQIEDIFSDYLSVTIYYKVSSFIFSKLKLSKDDIVIVY